MRIYSIRFVSEYAYSAAAHSGLHAARLLPTDTGGQSVLQARLDVEPLPAAASVRSDFFGNTVSLFRLDNPHQNLLLTMQATVDVHREVQSSTESPNWSDAARSARSVRSLSAHAPANFLQPTPFTTPYSAIHAFARQHFPPGRPILEASTGLCEALHRTLRYDPEATTVATDAETALAIGAGVCQDFAHIFIAACRSVGVPARYVTGYLRTLPPPGQPRLEGADAMHAWASVWAGDTLGWVDFDPTNGCRVADEHIEVAIGRDHEDTSPIIGQLMASGDQEHSVAVDVIEIGGDQTFSQQQTEPAVQ